jgi:nucleoside-diphosphate kinase
VKSALFLVTGRNRKSEEVVVLERTLAIIKPDAVERNLIGQIIHRLEDAGLRPRAMRMIRLDRDAAAGFYQVHTGKPFFDSLVGYMTSGPVVVMVLEGEDAIVKWRTVMGATDPAKADEGTIRRDFGVNIEHNSTHGSDAPETARFEIGYFFNSLEIV